MKATTGTTRMSVRRTATLIDAPARPTRRYEGKHWRPDTVIIEYALYPDDNWEALTVTLTGHVLKQNGQASARRYPAEIQYAWGADPELSRLVDILRPRPGGTYAVLADYDLSKES